MTTPDDGLTGRELEPTFRTDRLPAPHDLVGILRERLEGVVREERDARGEIFVREDTYPLVRRLAALSEGLTDYGRAFLKVAKEVNGYVQDDLELMVGEQDGIPNSGAKVPDMDGTDLKIELDKRYSYQIDLDAVLSAATLYTLDQPAFAPLLAVASAEELASLVLAGMETVLACGSFTPQKTKVEQLKTEVARTNPTVASTITVQRSAEFRGIKIKREQPK